MISKATEGIYRGARPLDLSEMQELKALGMKSILNLQGGDTKSKMWKYISWHEPGENPEYINAEKSVADTIGMGFENIPLNSLDPVSSDEDKEIDRALEFMNNTENQPLYVHCEHGKDRTGLVVALYKVKYENVPVADAYAEWVRKGHDKKAQIFTGDLDDYFYKKVKEFQK